MTIRTIVLFSGGQDSTTCLYEVLRNSRAQEVMALSFDYRQRHRIELERAAQIASLAGVRHEVVPVTLSVPSFLTTGDASPRADGLPPTFVPGRNLIFLSHAFALAGATGAREIVFGANAIDYSGYPDCRPEFVEAMAAAGGAALGRSVRLLAPLIGMSKKEICELATPACWKALRLSWSCYDPQPGDRTCGVCAACALRAKGFEEAGLTDPAT